MPVHRAAALVLLVFSDFGSNSAAAQAKGPASVFGRELAQIQSKTRIPVVLPSRLPSVIPEKNIKATASEVREDGYSISLYFSEGRGNAAFAAGFGGSLSILGAEDLPNARQVALSGGRTGLFRPVSCGGSCAPASLWWEQSGVMYQIQVMLRSNSSEADQEKILIETANSCVTVRPPKRK